jgi:hypothetical protein
MHKTVALPLGEVVRAEIYRGKQWGYSAVPDEIPCMTDLIVNPGRIFLAKRIAGGDTVASAMAYMAVGTGTTAPALTNSTVLGEVKRKLSSTNSATANNIYTNVATWGGAADVVTSIAIAEAGVFNHASSGNGTMFQRVTFSPVTLADSDLLKIELTTARKRTARASRQRCAHEQRADGLAASP